MTQMNNPEKDCELLSMSLLRVDRFYLYLRHLCRLRKVISSPLLLQLSEFTVSNYQSSADCDTDVQPREGL